MYYALGRGITRSGLIAGLVYLGINHTSRAFGQGAY
jgi:hypothetical protein